MRMLFIFALLGSLSYGAFWTLQKNSNWSFAKRFDAKTLLQDMLPSFEFHTLEIHYTASQIMEAHKSELLKSAKHKYLETQTQFYPYLLMEVKYCNASKKTEESLMLWDLCDGEMVLNTRGWEKTHGFADCLSSNITGREFSIIRFLAKKGGTCSREEALLALRLENEVLDTLVSSLRKKHLVVVAGDRYRLHLQNPNIRTIPATQIHERLVTKTGKTSKKVSKRYSFSQIERLSKAAFGEEFAVRHTMDVYLPVHSIVVQNPDGSLHTSLWNALNGKRIFYSYGID